MSQPGIEVMMHDQGYEEGRQSMRLENERLRGLREALGTALICWRALLDGDAIDPTELDEQAYSQCKAALANLDSTASEADDG